GTHLAKSGVRGSHRRGLVRRPIGRPCLRRSVMWKKWSLLGGLLVCLGLPAFASADAIREVPVAVKTIPVDLKGKLQRLEADDVLQSAVRVNGPRFREWTVWQIVADGQAYELDLANRHDLWVLAERYV